MGGLRKVRVEIFGESFTVSGEAEADYMIDLARTVDTRMREIALGLSDPNPRKVAVLAALNFADELARKATVPDEAARRAIEERTNTLISLLDEGLIGDNLR